MRAKPEMKPWVHTDKSRMSSAGAALTEQVLALRCGCAAPLGLNKCVTMINPGLAPWAMQEYRPVGALRRLSPIDILYSFDALTQKSTNNYTTNPPSWNSPSLRVRS